ncbi:MAG: hypothetical protein DMF06_00420 [Verrucomicrobia bacterium]|nr:MAG: hypothetical protein DMF06_00420 [Verrucomicrobiota bacterium]
MNSPFAIRHSRTPPVLVPKLNLGTALDSQVELGNETPPVWIIPQFGNSRLFRTSIFEFRIFSVVAAPLVSLLDSLLHLVIRDCFELRYSNFGFTRAHRPP